MASSARRKPPAHAVTAERTRMENLYAQRREFAATHPSLSLQVWCGLEGLHVNASVDHLDSKGRLCRTVIAKAVLKTRIPTEADVVLWGARALSAWLETRILEMGEAELRAAQ